MIRIVLVAALAGVLPAVRQAQAGLPAQLLVGTWTPESTNDGYEIQVSWNQLTGRFEGALAQHGAASMQVGFSLGEICWIAAPTANPAIFDLQEEWRSGVGGRSTEVGWRHGVVRLDLSTANRLVTTVTTFRRRPLGRAGAWPSQQPQPVQSASASAHPSLDANEIARSRIPGVAGASNASRPIATASSRDEGHPPTGPNATPGSVDQFGGHYEPDGSYASRCGVRYESGSNKLLDPNGSSRLQDGSKLAFPEDEVKTEEDRRIYIHFLCEQWETWEKKHDKMRRKKADRK